MSREQKVAAGEAYLDCFVTKNVSQVPFAEDVTFEGSRMPKLTGRQTVVGFLASIMPSVKGIQVKQHIVEGDYVATVFDMETVNGVDHVFDRDSHCRRRDQGSPRVLLSSGAALIAAQWSGSLIDSTPSGRIIPRRTSHRRAFFVQVAVDVALPDARRLPRAFFGSSGMIHVPNIKICSPSTDKAEILANSNGPII